jgi:hypothetical protein
VVRAAHRYPALTVLIVLAIAATLMGIGLVSTSISPPKEVNRIDWPQVVRTITTTVQPEDLDRTQDYQSRESTN